jgi:hypothetical protein
LIDCQETACLLKRCGTIASQACCSVGPSATSCIDLSTSPANCSGCGIACKSGSTCVPVTLGPLRSGRCTCSVDADCPQEKAGLLGSDQDCVGGHCGCNEDNADKECGPGTTCTELEGLGAPGWCHP